MSVDSFKKKWLNVTMFDQGAWKRTFSADFIVSEGEHYMKSEAALKEILLDKLAAMLVSFEALLEEAVKEIETPEEDVKEPSRIIQ